MSNTIQEQSIWDRCKFPTMHLTAQTIPFKRKTLANPFTWTPTEPFYFGGNHFIPLYPCAAYETLNFGWVVQHGPHGIIVGSY